MILSDYDLANAIKSKRIVVRPFFRETLRENGIDFRLSNEIAHHPSHFNNFTMDPENPAHIRESYKVTKSAGRLLVASHEQVLLSTLEYIEMPDDLMGFVEIRSTWARHGFSMPPTIIDAGFKGTITLEVINNAPYTIALTPGQRFAHVIFMKTNNKVESVYRGRYLGQKGIRLPKVIKRKSSEIDK